MFHISALYLLKYSAPYQKTLLIVHATVRMFLRFSAVNKEHEVKFLAHYSIAVLLYTLITLTGSWKKFFLVFRL